MVTLPVNTKSIFILRNNDIGDLLVITPLFEALRKKFPDADIIAGIGSWNVDVLKFNPYITEVFVVNAPWHNKVIKKQSKLGKLGYILFSRQAKKLDKRRFNVGIDILGSKWGSLLMMRANIPFRLGVRGYAGGHTMVQKYIEYNPQEHVGRSALRFAELLGATELPEAKPQIYLSNPEKTKAKEAWNTTSGKRIIIGPGGGFKEKCWPIQNYTELIKKLSLIDNLSVIIVGGSQDKELGEQIKLASPSVRNLAGELSLRETFALTAESDFVICNSSFLMHVAAAFSKPAVVLLGEWYASTRQHFTQWGYKENCYMFGKEESERNRVYTSFEITEVFKKLLQDK